MGSFARDTGTARSLRMFLAALCVLLVVLFGTVQAAHTHGNCGDTHANCPLCATAHVAPHPAQTPAPAPVSRLVARVEMAPPVELPSRFFAFSHYTRPPPEVTLPA